MFDTLQILFWSITYVLIIVAGSRSKKVSMPYLAGVLNFSWEIVALNKSRGFWGHIVWFLLDCIIVCIGFRALNTKGSRMLYVSGLVIVSLLLSLVFVHPEGMLYSVFIIDLIMAICFVINVKRLSYKFKISIAITKLLGDIFAGIHYGFKNPVIALIAVVVLGLNIIYLYVCIREYFHPTSKQLLTNGKSV